MGATIFYPGGTQKSEQWDDAAQVYTAWNADGTVRITRPYTAIEQAAATASAASALSMSNQQTLQQRAQAALTANGNFVNQAKPSTAAAQASQAYDQAVTLSKENTALIRLLLNLLDSTAGT